MLTTVFHIQLFPKNRATGIISTSRRNLAPSIQGPHHYKSLSHSHVIPFYYCLITWTFLVTFQSSLTPLFKSLFSHTQARIVPFNSRKHSHVTHSEHQGLGLHHPDQAQPSIYFGKCHFCTRASGSYCGHQYPRDLSTLQTWLLKSPHTAWLQNNTSMCYQGSHLQGSKFCIFGLITHHWNSYHQSTSLVEVVWVHF